MEADEVVTAVAARMVAGGDVFHGSGMVEVTKMVTDMWWGGEDAAVRWRWRWWPTFGVVGGWPEWVAAPET
ncbi:hypothetical protein Tco_1061086 [Tanacetum coccineum]